MFVVKVVLRLVALVALVVCLSGMVPAADGVQLTPEVVVSVMGAGLALALEVVPGLAPRWAGLPAELKRFVWLIGCALVGAGPTLLGCAASAMGVDLTVFVYVGECTTDSLAAGMQVAFLAYFASQSAHGLTVGALKLFGVYKGGDGRGGS